MRFRTRMMPAEDQGLFRHLDRAIAELDSAQQVGVKMLRQASREPGQDQRSQRLQGVLATVRRTHQMLLGMPRLVPTLDMTDPDLQPEETKVAPVPKQARVQGT